MLTNVTFARPAPRGLLLARLALIATGLTALISGRDVISAANLRAN